MDSTLSFPLPYPNTKQYFVRFYPFQPKKSCDNIFQNQYNFNQRLSNQLFLLWWNNHHDKDERDVKKLSKLLIGQHLLLWLIAHLSFENLTFRSSRGILLLCFSGFLTIFLACLAIFMSQIVLNCSFQLSFIFSCLLSSFLLLTILAKFYLHIAFS